MKFGRKPLHRITAAATLTLLLIAIVQFARFYIIDEFTRPGNPNEMDGIASLIITPGITTYGRVGMLPSTWFNCYGDGGAWQQCGGRFGDSELSFRVRFNGGYVCEATYDGAPLTCTGAFNGDDYSKPIVLVNLHLLDMSEQQIKNRTALGLIAPYRSMIVAWIIVLALWPLVVFDYWWNRPKSPLKPTPLSSIT